jgi:hypothetical protein
MTPAAAGYTGNRALTYFMHEIEQVKVERFFPEAFMDHLEDGAL